MAETEQTPTSTPTGTHQPLGRDGKALPKSTKVDLNLNTRLMVEEYIGWYYPGVKPTLDGVVEEMLSIAWARAKNDPTRPETADQRRARLTDGQS